MPFDLRVGQRTKFIQLRDFLQISTATDLARFGVGLLGFFSKWSRTHVCRGQKLSYRETFNSVNEFKLFGK